MKTGIITCDIVSSTAIENNDKGHLYEDISRSFKRLRDLYNIESFWYRGDAFQIRVDAKNSLRVALLIKTWTRSRAVNKTNNEIKIYDVRMAIGLGEVDFEKDSLAQSDGEAFHLSGRSLDALKNSKYNFIIATNDQYKEALRIESMMLNAIIDKTTSSQNRVLYYKLLRYTEERIADELKITQSAVNQHSNAGNWDVILNYVEYFERLYRYE